MSLATTSFADKKPEAPKPTEPTVTEKAKVSVDSQIDMLKKQHAVDKLKSRQGDLNARWSQIQDAARQTSSEFESTAKEMEKATKDLNEAKEAAAKSAGLDPAKYDVNVEAGTFDPKPSPAPTTPSPEKK